MSADTEPTSRVDSSPVHLEGVLVRGVEDPTEFDALRDLRWRVLRPGRPRESVNNPEDAMPGTVHLGAFLQDRLVGIASLHPVRGLQLRGMAVEPDLQRSGIGAAILAAAHKVALERRQTLWCNARDTAIGFYERNGWVVEGEGFVVPDVGPHHVMRWQGIGDER